MQDQHEILDDRQSCSSIAVTDMYHAGNQPNKERVAPTSFVVAPSVQLNQRAQQRADDERSTRSAGLPRHG